MKHLYKIYSLQGLNHYYTLKATKGWSATVGVTVTMSNMKTVQKIQKDKMFNENLILQWQTEKNGQILQNGQMRFFMASTV